MLGCLYNITVCHAVGEPGHSKDVVDVINSIYNIVYNCNLDKVQLPVSRDYDDHMIVHTSTHTYDVSLEGEFQK